MTKETTFDMIPVSHLFFHLFFMTTIQKIGYVSLGSVISFFQNSSVFAAANAAKSDLFGNGQVSKATGADDTVDVEVQNLIQNALIIVGLVAVVYGIYGGVLMMTAGGDEEKVKKGRTIIIQVLIGIVVIFLANSIIRWFLSTVMGSGTGV